MSSTAKRYPYKAKLWLKSKIVTVLCESRVRDGYVVVMRHERIWEAPEFAVVPLSPLEKLALVVGEIT